MHNLKAGIYIHIPFCHAKCIYCDFYSVADRNDEIPEFVDLICAEIDLFFTKNEAPWHFDTIFFGGGTPSLLEASSIEKIISTLNKYLDLSNIEEFTVETNPGEIEYNRLKDFLSIGVNRLSLGFQSFDDNLLSFLGRLHSSKDCIKTYENARKAGFGNINADLIFDIPGQTIQRWKQDLKTLVELEPEHISTYSLTVEKQTNLFKLVQAGRVTMPSETLDISMYTHSLDFLKQKKYLQYEISNHSKEDYTCKHNLHYWKNDPYISFGPSAHSYDMNKRWWNINNLTQYSKSIKNNELPIQNEELLTDKDHFNELIFNGLRMQSGVKIENLEKYYNDSITDYIELNMKKWDGLNYENGFFFLDDNARLLADEIASDLFI